MANASGSFGHTPGAAGRWLARLASTKGRDTRPAGRRGLLPYLMIANIALVWLVSGAVIWHNRDVAIRDWSVTAARSDQLAAAYAAEAMSAGGMILDSMVDWVREEKVATAEEFDSKFNQREYHERLSRRIDGLQYVDKAAFLSRDGRVLSFTVRYPTPNIDVADRDYFIEQVGPNPPAVSLGKSVRDRGTGKWGFFLAKRVQAPTGEVLGVVLVGFEAGHIADYFHETAVKNNGAVSLWRSDGTLLATTNTQPDILGRNFPNAPSVTLFRRDPRGTVAFVGSPRLSGAEEQRLLAVHPVAAVPAFVSLSIGEDTILGSWRRDAYIVVAIAVALTIVSLLGWLLFHAEQTSRLEAQNAMIQSAKMATLGRMATAMAHEINQPINIIQLAAENARAELETARSTDSEQRSPEERQLDGYLLQRLDRILSQTQRAGTLISHMRIFGRVPKEKAAPFDIREACKAAIELTSPQVRNSAASVDARLGDRPLAVVGYKVLLEQVIVNLMLNAADAMRIAECEVRRIEIRCYGRDGKAFVEVSDTGPGIHSKIRDRIFEPFFTTKPIGQGTGLGLAFSHGVLREMGGTLSLVDGTPSTFLIELPMEESAREARPGALDKTAA